MLGERRMRDARYLREQARRCRDLLRTAVEPGLIEQLRLWSVELADEADEIVRRASSARKTPRRSSPVRSSAKPTLAIVKRASFPDVSRFQARPGEANISAGGQGTDIDLKAFLNAGAPKFRASSALAPNRSGARQRQASTG